MVAPGSLVGEAVAFFAVAVDDLEARVHFERDLHTLPAGQGLPDPGSCFIDGILESPEMGLFEAPEDVAGRGWMALHDLHPNAASAKERIRVSGPNRFLTLRSLDTMGHWALTWTAKAVRFGGHLKEPPLSASRVRLHGTPQMLEGGYLLEHNLAKSREIPLVLGLG